MTNRIRKLDPHIANQIAAGEVIERPANAVKELVENALDAGARRITIDIEEGGKKLIRVRDDGSGMNASDAVLALQRHATSKLRDADDLFAIRTLGFRGEALPSIAAVSRIELTSQEADAEAGVKLIVEAGTVLDVSEIGATPGTEIVIQNLFYNTPARFKFLKSDAAEAGRIGEMIGHLALAYPDVAFRLRHNGTESLRAEAGGNAMNAVVSVLGRETARQMLPIAPSSEAHTSEIRVTGFVGRPQLTRANRNHQIFFVNGRVVKNRTLQHAVAASYEGLLHGHGRYPIAVIFIQIPPNSVDVNVHPTKSEVRFAREWEVHHAVRIAMRETLVASQLAPDWGLGERAAIAPSAPVITPTPSPSLNPTEVQDYRGYYQPVAPRGGDFDEFREVSRAPSSFGGVNGSSSLPGWPNAAPQNLSANQSTLYGNLNQQTLPDMEEPAPTTLRLRPLAQISNNAYILCEGEDGLYIVCQHRAHERILADRAIAAAEGRPVQSQHLVIPYTLDIGPRASAALDENGALLKDLGWEIEAFGGSSVLVRAVPALVANKDYEVAFQDLLDELVAGGAVQSLADRRKKLLTMLACKNAIKAGDPLQMEQIQQLLEDLMTVPNPSICPHGQPILIKISTLELDKKFEREYASR